MLVCGTCDATQEISSTFVPRCECGGLWTRWTAPPALPTSRLRPTPLWSDPVDHGLLWKREDLNPTGSFKDRGAEVVVGLAAAAGARELVVDSSGSAALAAASAAAQRKLPLTVHTPQGLPRAKHDALSTLGARVVAEGSREDAARRASQAAQEAFLVSHVYHPGSLEGTHRSALEVLDANVEGEVWLVPVGNGSLLLGLALALERRGNSRIALVAVQSAEAPGLRANNSRAASQAAGINIATPPRRTEIVLAVEAHEGEVLEVSESALQSAHQALAHRGVLGELASAAALAGFRTLRARGDQRPVVAWLSGSGIRG